MSSIIQMFQNKASLIWLVLRIPVVLFSLSFHEASHAFAAHKLGDDTAKNLGRLTLNPIKHLDLIGAICLFFFGIGWAKPVPIMTRNFKNPKKGMAISALAGPVSNVLLSLIGLFLCSLFARIFGYDGSETGILRVIANNRGNTAAFLLCLFFYIFHLTNLLLAMFNMLPVPPLDGSRLALLFLPEKAYFAVMKYERIIMIVFLALLFFAGFDLLGKVGYAASDGLFLLVSKIPGMSGAEYTPAVLTNLLYKI